MKKLSLLIFIMLLSMTKVDAQQSFSIDFDESNYSIQNFEFKGKEYKVRAYENIPYVTQPIDVNYQIMNIHVPDGYFSGKTIKIGRAHV